MVNERQNDSPDLDFLFTEEELEEQEEQLEEALIEDENKTDPVKDLDIALEYLHKINHMTLTRQLDRGKGISAKELKRLYDNAYPDEANS